MREYLNICIDFNFGDLKKNDKNLSFLTKWHTYYYFLIFRITFMNLSPHRCIKATFVYRMHFVLLFYDETKKLH